MEKYYDVQKPQKPGEPIQYWNQTNKYLIALHLLLENYCHFLMNQNGRGRIVYEHISEAENNRISGKFYQIKMVGLYYPGGHGKALDGNSICPERRE